MVITLRDVIEEMERRGSSAEALSYRLYVTTYLETIHDVPPERAMNMSINKVTSLLVTPPRPLKYRDWDTFYWGKAKFAGDHG